MTPALEMHTTGPPPSAQRPAAGVRLCHARKLRLYSYGAASGKRYTGLAGVPNVLPITGLTGPLAHFTGIRLVKSP